MTPAGKESVCRDAGLLLQPPFYPSLCLTILVCGFHCIFFIFVLLQSPALHIAAPNNAHEVFVALPKHLFQQKEPRKYSSYT